MTAIPRHGDFAIHLDRRRHRIWFWMDIGLAVLILPIALAEPFILVASVLLLLIRLAFAGRALDPRPGLLLTDTGIAFPQTGGKVSWGEIQEIGVETVRFASDRPLLPMPYSDREDLIRFRFLRPVPPSPDIVSRFALRRSVIGLLHPPRRIPLVYSLPQPLATVTDQDLLAAVEMRRAEHVRDWKPATAAEQAELAVTENADGTVTVGDRTFTSPADADAYAQLCARQRGFH